MTQKSINNAFDGFEYKGREYPGVAQLIEDLKWALENEKWKLRNKYGIIDDENPIMQRLFKQLEKNLIRPMEWQLLVLLAQREEVLKNRSVLSGLL